MGEDSSINIYDLCITKDMQILDLFQNTTILQEKNCGDWRKKRRIMESKDKFIEGMSKEVDRILADKKKGYENSIKIIEPLTKIYEEIIQTLQDELRKHPDVLNIPPIEIVVGQEEKLMNALKG